MEFQRVLGFPFRFRGPTYLNQVHKLFNPFYVTQEMCRLKSLAIPTWT